MSEPVGIICLDCRVAAPPIGDFGFIGWPSMDEEPTEATAEEWNWAELLPFGCIRRAFLDIGISTDELEQFASFMQGHDGHRFGMESDGELQHPYEGGQEIVDEIEAAGGSPSPLSYSDLSERARDGFILGSYTLHCDCGAAYSPPESTILRPLPDVRWTSDLLDRFRSRILEIDPCNFWRVTEHLLDPGMPNDEPVPPLQEIGRFVAAHLPHGVTGGVTSAG